MTVICALTKPCYSKIMRRLLICSALRMRVYDFDCHDYGGREGDTRISDERKTVSDSNATVSDSNATVSDWMVSDSMVSNSTVSNSIVLVSDLS